MQRGEIWLVSLDPTAGHEQRGTRPVVIVSPAPFNELTRTPVVLPITTGGSFARRRGHPNGGRDPLRPAARPRSCRPERETPRSHSGADHGRSARPPRRDPGVNGQHKFHLGCGGAIWFDGLRCTVTKNSRRTMPRWGPVPGRRRTGRAGCGRDGPAALSSGGFARRL